MISVKILMKKLYDVRLQDQILFIVLHNCFNL